MSTSEGFWTSQYTTTGGDTLTLNNINEAMFNFTDGSNPEEKKPKSSKKVIWNMEDLKK